MCVVGVCKCDRGYVVRCVSVARCLRVVGRCVRVRGMCVFVSV